MLRVSWIVLKHPWCFIVAYELHMYINDDVLYNDDTIFRG